MEQKRHFPVLGCLCNVALHNQIHISRSTKMFHVNLSLLDAMSVTFGVNWHSAESVIGDVFWQVTFQTALEKINGQMIRS